jgi:hypothetical protein
MGVEVWALPDEMLPDRDNPAYIVTFLNWQAEFSQGMFSLLSEAMALSVDDATRARREFAELQRQELAAGGYTEWASVLMSTALGSDADFGAACELVQYNSTVTLRGIVEAAKAYNVRLRGKKVPVAVLGDGGKATANGEYNDRMVAQWAGYKWAEFCELTGPEQSAEVALYRISQRIERMMSK